MRLTEWEKAKSRIKVGSPIKGTVKSHKPFGIGKPEPLKYNWTGYWSRRITQKHRLVYKVTEGRILVAQCKFHY